jgi:4a-hydroxytetrahydrobiopterin dehydratase
MKGSTIRRLGHDVIHSLDLHPQRKPSRVGFSRENRRKFLAIAHARRNNEVMAVLTDEQVDAALPEGWQRIDGALGRSVKFPAFLDGIAAVQRVAEVAEVKDHHPDIDIRWRTVTFTLVTHSEGGITDRDVEMARSINEIVG